MVMLQHMILLLDSPSAPLNYSILFYSIHYTTTTYRKPHTDSTATDHHCTSQQGWKSSNIAVDNSRWTAMNPLWLTNNCQHSQTEMDWGEPSPLPYHPSLKNRTQVPCRWQRRGNQMKNVCLPTFVVCFCVFYDLTVSTPIQHSSQPSHHSTLESSCHITNSNLATERHDGSRGLPGGLLTLPSHTRSASATAIW